MVASGSVREFVQTAVVLSFLSFGCQKAEAPPAASPPAVPATAPVAAQPAKLVPTSTGATADQKPEPEVHPCRGCQVDVTRAVSGSWQHARCMPGDTADVTYPASLAVVEVVSGNQKGEQFAVSSEPSTFQLDAGYAGTLPAAAKPDTWSEAKLWITDATGAKCSSLLAIRR